MLGRSDDLAAVLDWLDECADICDERRIPRRETRRKIRHRRMDAEGPARGVERVSLVKVLRVRRVFTQSEVTTAIRIFLIGVRVCSGGTAEGRK